MPYDPSIQVLLKIQLNHLHEHYTKASKLLEDYISKHFLHYTSQNIFLELAFLGFVSHKMRSFLYL